MQKNKLKVKELDIFADVSCNSLYMLGQIHETES